MNGHIGVKKSVSKYPFDDKILISKAFSKYDFKEVFRILSCYEPIKDTEAYSDFNLFYAVYKFYRGNYIECGNYLENICEDKLDKFSKSAYCKLKLAYLFETKQDIHQALKNYDISDELIKSIDMINNFYEDCEFIFKSRINDEHILLKHFNQDNDNNSGFNDDEIVNKCLSFLTFFFSIYPESGSYFEFFQPDSYNQLPFKRILFKYDNIASLNAKQINYFIVIYDPILHNIVTAYPPNDLSAYQYDNNAFSDICLKKIIESLKFVLPKIGVDQKKNIYPYIKFIISYYMNDDVNMIKYLNNMKENYHCSSQLHDDRINELYNKSSQLKVNPSYENYYEFVDNNGYNTLCECLYDKFLNLNDIQYYWKFDTTAIAYLKCNNIARNIYTNSSYNNLVVVFDPICKSIISLNFIDVIPEDIEYIDITDKYNFKKNRSNNQRVNKFNARQKLKNN